MKTQQIKICGIKLTQLTGNFMALNTYIREKNTLK